MSLSFLFSYIFLGLSLAAPIGPVNAAQMDRGIKSGFFHAWMVGVGAMIGDAFYMALVYFGIVHFINIPMVKAFLWSFGCFVLIYTGVESFMSSKTVTTTQSEQHHESVLKAFFSGFMMSVSSPLTILFWLGIYGSILAETTSLYDTKELVLASAAIFLGVAIWDVTMAGIASSFRQILNIHLLFLISVISSISLIGFGLYFGFEAFKLLF